MNGNNNFEHLPCLVLENILLRLPADDLHSCRQVNKKMNNFIKNEIWGRKRNRKVLTKRLEENFRTSKYKTCSEKTITGNFSNLFVEIVSSGKVLIRSYYDEPISQSTLLCYDVKNESMWSVAGMDAQVDAHLHGLETFDNYQTFLTDNLLGTAIHFKTMTVEGDRLANIRILNIQRKQEIFNENIKNVQFVATEKYQYHNIVVVFSNKT